MNNSMYTIVKNHIDRGNFKIGEIVLRIREELWNGHITENECSELIDMAHAKVNPNSESPELLDIVKNIIKRVEKLEAKNETDVPDNSETTVSYPEWKPWDGISKDHQKDAIVSHNGKLWQSTFDGQNVWEPGAPGIDERYWIEYIPNE